MARELHIGLLYPLFTGNLFIPEGKSYWYLCNEQDNTEGSEIYQLTKKLRENNGKKYFFAKPHQCYGVDRGKIIIDKNTLLHPYSNWIHSEWRMAIHDQNFNPSLVYLDTTSFANKLPAAEVLKETLKLCVDKNTLLIANVMMSNARAGNGDKLFDVNDLIDNILNSDHPKTFEGWNISPNDNDLTIFHSYEYKTSKALMRSYIFFKGVLPPTNKIMKEFDSFKDWCSLSFSQLNLV